MRPTLEGAVADKEVLHIAHHPLILTLRLRAGWSAGAGAQSQVARQIHKPWMEPSRTATRMCEHRRFLIVDQDLGGYPAEPLEAADQPVIGVLGVLAIRTPEVESP